MQPANIAARDRLIVALDLPSVAAAEAMIARLGEAVSFYKIGYQLAYAGGLPVIRQLADNGKKVFADLKLHDIGHTVARGVESVARLGATFLTVHAYPKNMKAAVEARAGSGLKILAVTVLTSYDDGDLHAAGYRLGVSDLVEARAQQAQVLGVDGLVSSPEEAASLHKIVGHQMVLVTPGIRPAGAASGDQKRIMTPARAIAAGSDYLVVGRPVVEAADPKAGAEGIPAEVAQGVGRQQGETSMAKGYWIARIDFHNPDGYKEYVAQNGAVFAKYGGRFLVRGGQHVAKEGSSRTRNVVIEFRDYETAIACY